MTSPDSRPTSSSARLIAKKPVKPAAKNTQNSVATDSDRVRIYARCDVGFQDVLEQEVLEWSAIFKSLHIDARYASGLIVEGFAQDIASLVYFAQSLEHAWYLLGVVPGAARSVQGAKTAQTLRSSPSAEEFAQSLDFSAYANKDAICAMQSSFSFRTLLIADPLATTSSWRETQSHACTLKLAALFSAHALHPTPAWKDVTYVVGVAFDSLLGNAHIPAHLSAQLREQNGAQQNALQQEDIEQQDVIFGIALTSKDLFKRIYKITSTGASIRGTVAYALLRLLDPDAFKKQQMLLDPFCATGEVCIEAALYSTRTSPWKYEKSMFSWAALAPFRPYTAAYLTSLDSRIERDPIFRIRCVSPHFGHLAIARKHAKVAGVEHVLDFSRIEYKWLDIKFPKGGVDAACSFVGAFRSELNDSGRKKEAMLFFYQLEYLLAGNAQIILMTQDSIPYQDAAKAYGFSLIQVRKALMGAQPMSIIALKHASSHRKSSEPLPLL